MTVKIALVGKMRSGKDTFAEPLLHSKSMYHLRFADGIQEIIDNFFPEAVSGNGKPREHYQVIGQSLRELDPDVWVNSLEQEYLNILRMLHILEDSTSGIIITDVRQPNEVEWCRQNGFKLVKLSCPSEVRRQRIIDCGDVYEEEQFTHETENYVDCVAANYVIDSSCSKKELQKQAVELYKKLAK